MPNSVGSRFRTWRAAASRFTEYGLEAAAGAPMGEFFVAPVAKLMGDVKVSIEPMNRGLVKDIAGSILSLRTALSMGLQSRAVDYA